MGLLSRFEGKMEDTVEGAADRMGAAPLSPVQIAKKAEKQMRREKMVGAGKQYAPTLYTVLVNADDDERLFGYYPTLAGETETYLAAKASEHGLIMDGQPLVRFIVDEELKHGKFEVIAEMVAAPLVAQLRQEEMERYGLAVGAGGRGVGYRPSGAAPAPAPAPDPYGFNECDAYAGDATYGQAQGEDGFYDNPADGYGEAPQTMVFDPAGGAAGQPQQQAYLYDITNDRAFPLDGRVMIIGRESRNDIVIPDINVSRQHAEIRREATGAWVISDLGSTNGTFVNGRQIKSTPLQDADRLTLGTTSVEFQLI